jgi:serine/threonine-protein kinase
MTPEAYERMWRLYDEALALDPVRRQAFLDQRCGDDPGLRDEVCRLLARAEAGDGGTVPDPCPFFNVKAALAAAPHEPLDREPCPAGARGPLPAGGPATVRTAPPAAEPDDALIGRKVGPYLIEQRVGRGGMGSVYRALREDAYRQQVALQVERRASQVGQAGER